MKQSGTNDISTTKGFTRADLMACLAALTVLTALAASGLSSSKDNVNRMVCGSNMRQLALAVGMYTADNRDYLPYCNWDGGSGIDPAPGWLYTLPIPKNLIGAGQDSIPNPFVSPWNTSRATSVSGLPDSAWQSGSLFVYMKTHRSYLCPTDIQSPDWSALAGGRNNRLSSYVMDGAACNFGGENGSPQVTKVADVWSPNCYLAYEPNENTLGPYNPGAFEYNDGANFPTVPPNGGEGLGLIHGNNGGEIVTVGGNVNFVLFSAFNAQSSSRGSGPNGQSLAWWAPGLPSGGWNASDE